MPPLDHPAGTEGATHGASLSNMCSLEQEEQEEKQQKQGKRRHLDDKDGDHDDERNDEQGAHAPPFPSETRSETLPHKAPSPRYSLKPSGREVLRTDA